MLGLKLHKLSAYLEHKTSFCKFVTHFNLLLSCVSIALKFGSWRALEWCCTRLWRYEEARSKVALA